MYLNKNLILENYKELRIHQKSNPY